MDDYGNTPLHWAAEKNQVESVKFLLRKGANPNLRNCDMMAPLHVAVQGLYNNVMKVRLQAATQVPTIVAWAGTHVQLCLPAPEGQPQLPGPTECIDFNVGFSSDQLTIVVLMMMTMRIITTTVFIDQFLCISYQSFSVFKSFPCFSFLNPPHLKKIYKVRLLLPPFHS